MSKYAELVEERNNLIVQADATSTRFRNTERIDEINQKLEELEEQGIFQ
jgi:hypothetical protein